MWLFDELLGKTGTTPTIGSTGSTSSGTSSSWQQQDPIAQVAQITPVVISESIPLGVPTVNHSESMPTTDISTEPVSSFSPQLSSVIELTSPMVEMAPSPAMVAESITPATPASATMQTEGAIASMPVQTPTQAIDTTPLEKTEPENNAGIFELISTPTIEEKKEILPASSPHKSSILEDSDAPVESKEESTTPLFAFADNTATAAPWEEEILLSQAEIEPVVTLYDTKSFLEKAIAEIGIMIQNMDDHHDGKLAEVAEHRAQKNHYASLEKEAQHEADSMITERAKAEAMREYLKSELKGGHKKASVKTALTEIGTQETVSKTMKWAKQSSTKIHA